MTSAEYREVLNLLGLTQAEMAELLGVSVRTAHGYANGARIPEPVARFLALTLPKYERGRPRQQPGLSLDCGADGFRASLAGLASSFAQLLRIRNFCVAEVK